MNWMDNQDSLELARQLLLMLPRLSRLLVHYVESISENEATLMQFSALHMLMEKPMTMSDLAKKRRVSLQAASVFVQGLVERGWVVRVPDPDDRRRSILEVTPEGHEQERYVRDQMTAYLASLITEFTPEEQSAAQIFMKSIDRVLQQHDVIDCTDQD